MQRVVRSAVIDAPIERVWEVLRDFNSHVHWHPVVAEGFIEGGLRSDQVGCVRNFKLADGNHLREQLLVLDDRQHISTYCILDATLPIRRYVAVQQCRRVTDGDRTFIHWQSTFEVPRGQEAEFDARVGDGVYVAGFEALRRWLRRGAALPAARSAAARQAVRATAMRLRAHGGPEVLEPATIDVPAPGPGEIRVRHTAIGVNFIDLYIRSGEYGGMITLPGVLGMEAAGVVDEVGPGVEEVERGDRVATLTPQPGSYAALRTLSVQQAVKLPPSVSDEAAASLMLKGITAQYLMHDLGHVGPGLRVLVHAAAGGVGLLASNWARALGAIVIGTVGSDAKARVAREAGCERVIVAPDGRFADAVLEATGGRGADLILDGLGASARDENMRCLAMRGHWVAFGHSSGAMEPVSADWLGSRSATFSRPVVFHYTAEPGALQRRAGIVFDALARGLLRWREPTSYPLTAAAQAHADLAARRTVGSIILRP
jgi:NADPH:quinone reductase-like Zn-dependent oxidoreductase